MSKPTKSSMTNKLDKICSLIVRSHGQCVMCLRSDYEKLQCAHIYSRTFRNTRWDLRNLLPLCISCHFKSHRNPIEFTEFVKAHLGLVEYESLKIRHNSIKKWALQEMVDYYNSLKEVKYP